MKSSDVIYLFGPKYLGYSLPSLSHLTPLFVFYVVNILSVGQWRNAEASKRQFFIFISPDLIGGILCFALELEIISKKEIKHTEVLNPISLGYNSSLNLISSVDFTF